MDYDASQAPDAETWLEADEDDRIEAVLEYHDGLDDHPEAGSMQAHARMHAIVETQIASGEPAATGEKLDELTDAGVDRHAALHAIAGPVSHVVYGVAGADESADDREVMARKVAEVTVEDGREQEKTWGAYAPDE
jgi:hypothetical protein